MVNGKLWHFHRVNYFKIRLEKKAVADLVILSVLTVICCYPFISNLLKTVPYQSDFEATKWIFTVGGINPFGQEHLFHTLGLFGTINIIAGFFILRKIIC